MPVDTKRNPNPGNIMELPDQINPEVIHVRLDHLHADVEELKAEIQDTKAELTGQINRLDDRMFQVMLLAIGGLLATVGSMLVNLLS